MKESGGLYVQTRLVLGKEHVLHLKTFSEKHALYEIMWKNIVDLDKPQMTIWHMRIASGHLRLQTHTQNM
jgi:hypothetical protein